MKKTLHEFIRLFSDNPDPEIWKLMNRLCGTEVFTNEVVRKHKKLYESKEEFLYLIK